MDKVTASTKKKISLDTVSIFIILICSFLVYYPYISLQRTMGLPYLFGDCLYYRAMAVSIIEDQDLYVENNLVVTRDSEKQKAFLLNGQLAVSVNNQLVPKHPILMGIASIPFHILFNDEGFLIFNVINILLILIVIFKLNRMLFDEITSSITTMLYSASTLLLHYSYNFSPDLFATNIVLWGLFFYIKQKWSVSFLILGVSIFAKLTNVFVLVVVVLHLLYRNFHSKEFLSISIRAVISASIGLMPMLLANYAMFGSILLSGYHRTISGQTIIDNSTKFHQPLLPGLFQLLFNHDKGILLPNPIIIFSIIGGVIYLYRKQKFNPIQKDIMIISAFVIIIQLLFFSRYDEWYTSLYNNRFLSTAILLTSVWTAVFIDYFRKILKKSYV